MLLRASLTTPLAAALALALVACKPASESQPPCEQAAEGTLVLPLGDSLTRGKDDEPSYRYHLAQLRPELRTMGTRSGGGGGREDDGVHFDLDRYDFGACPHEGHGGYTWAQLDAGFDDWAASYEAAPQVILLLAGTNDAFYGEPTAESVAAAQSLVTRLDARFPEAQLLVGLPPPARDPEVDAALVALETELVPALAALDLEIDMDFVDLGEGFDPETMLQSDGLHPNAAGDAHLAAQWNAAWPPVE